MSRREAIFVHWGSTDSPILLLIFFSWVSFFSKQTCCRTTSICNDWFPYKWVYSCKCWYLHLREQLQETQSVKLSAPSGYQFQCRVDTLFSKLLFTNSKPIRKNKKRYIRKLVYYALTAHFWLLLVLRAQSPYARLDTKYSSSV